MLLEVNNVRKVYTTRLSTQSTEALKNVNFAVDNGEYVAIMGESGSGKTTLLNIIATFDKATSGNVNLNNLDIQNNPPGNLFRWIKLIILLFFGCFES